MRQIETYCLEDLKRDVSQNISQRFDLPRHVVHDVLRASFSSLREALAAGKRVRMESLGVFWPYERKARKGRNPLTGEQLMIPPRRYLKFRISNDLYKELNELQASKQSITEEIDSIEDINE